MNYKQLAILCGARTQPGYIEDPNGSGDSIYVEDKFLDCSEMNLEEYTKLIVLDCLKVHMILVKRHSNPNDVKNALFERLGLDKKE